MSASWGKPFFPTGKQLNYPDSEVRLWLPVICLGTSEPTLFPETSFSQTVIRNVYYSDFLPIRGLCLHLPLGCKYAALKKEGKR